MPATLKGTFSCSISSNLTFVVVITNSSNPNKGEWSPIGLITLSTANLGPDQTCCANCFLEIQSTISSEAHQNILKYYNYGGTNYIGVRDSLDINDDSADISSDWYDNDEDDDQWILCIDYIELEFVFIGEWLFRNLI